MQSAIKSAESNRKRGRKPKQSTPSQGSANTIRLQWLQCETRALMTALSRVKESQSDTAVHHGRVSIRRLRSLLKHWRIECQPVRYKKLMFYLQDISRTLAISRDAYIRLHLFTVLLEATNSETQNASSRIHSKLRNDLANSKGLLRQITHSAHWDWVCQYVETAIKKNGLMKLTPQNYDFNDELKAFKHGTLKLSKMKLNKYATNQALHKVRIKVKHVRYLGQALQDIMSFDLSTEINILKQLQSLLGELHDGSQLSNWCSHHIANNALNQLLHPRISARNVIIKDRLQALLEQLA